MCGEQKVRKIGACHSTTEKRVATVAHAVDGWYQRDLVVSDLGGCALLNGSVWMVEVGIVTGLAAADPAVPRSVFQWRTHITGLLLTITGALLAGILVLLEGEPEVAKTAVVPLDTVPLHRWMDSLRPRCSGEQFRAHFHRSFPVVAVTEAKVRHPYHAVPTWSQHRHC
jgi:hypothetical protein